MEDGLSLWETIGVDFTESSGHIGAEEGIRSTHTVQEKFLWISVAKIDRLLAGENANIFFADAFGPNR